MGMLRTIAALAALPAVLAITPTEMLGANRYSVAEPDPSGEYALFTATNYSFATHKSSSSWKRLDLKSKEVTTWFSKPGIGELVFIKNDPQHILYLNGSNEEEDGGVSIYYGKSNSPATAKLVASLPAPYSGLKATRTETGDIHFLLYAKAWPNGTAYNEQLATKPRSTARIYSSIYVRHWDYWLDEKKNAVFGGVLKTSNCSATLSGNLTNFVTGISNVTVAESPLDLNGADDYDLSPDGSKVVFLSKDIDLPLANYTSSQIWYVPFSGSAKDAVRINPRGSAKYPDAQGASAAPKFSPDSKSVAWVQMNGISYESDRNIIYVAKAEAENFDVTAVAAKWDRSPDSVVWSRDSKTLFVPAPDLGRQRIFPVPVDADDDFKPKNITDEGAVSGFFVLPSGDLLVSDNKIWTSRDISVVSPDGKSAEALFQANKVDPELASLGPQDVSEFYFSTNTTVSKLQSWIIYPKDFDKSKKYPLAFISHGGPQGAHYNSWSTRWNLKVWADQGYVVIAPNPTASSGWGQNLTDSIQERWGSYPYWDLVHAWEYVRDNLDYVDTDNGIEAGASFGGYMTNWMQGHEMGRWFKALVTHDGSTSTLNQFTTEELWFMEREFGRFTSASHSPGSPYYDWNPLLFADNFATPHFIIHNDLDFRLPVTEGILLFNVLQQKGVPSKFLNFPDENHWVLNRENSLVWHTELFKWINYYSGISNATSPY